MKVTHYLMPRCSGKTTFAKKLAEENKPMLFVESMGITDLKRLFNGFRGDRTLYNGAIIDEFIPLTEQIAYSRQWFIDSLKRLGINEIILTSTPDKVYMSEDIIMASLFDYSAFKCIEKKLSDEDKIKMWRKIDIYNEIRDKFLDIETNVVVQGEALFIKEKGDKEYKDMFGLEACMLNVHCKYKI